MVARAVISNKKKINTVLVENEGFYRSTVSEKKRTVLINQTLPFRIRFTDIKIPGYSSTNVPAIPLQVIGFSNYIL